MRPWTKAARAHKRNAELMGSVVSKDWFNIMDFSIHRIHCSCYWPTQIESNVECIRPPLKEHVCLYTTRDIMRPAPNSRDGAWRSPPWVTSWWRRRRWSAGRRGRTWSACWWTAWSWGRSRSTGSIRPSRSSRPAGSTTQTGSHTAPQPARVPDRAVTPPCCVSQYRRRGSVIITPITSTRTQAPCSHVHVFSPLWVDSPRDASICSVFAALHH